MAITFGCFSIREYASKMRSVDVEKSWPFFRAGEKLKKEEITGLLPPIACRKYRWWSDELEVARSGLVENPETGCTGTAVSGNTSDLGVEKLLIEEPESVLGAEEDVTVKICPVCGTFTAATINAVNAHIDSCLAQASREERRKMRTEGAAKAKSRAPKKRSIVEIFAVAPQIERLDDDDDDEEDEEDKEEGSSEGEAEDPSESDVVKSSAEMSLKRNRRKRKLKKKKESVETLMKKKKKKKKKKDKKNLLKKKKKKKNPNGILAFSNRLAAEKEKIHKLKMLSSIDYSQLLQSTLHNKKSGKEIGNPVGMQKKKPSNIKGILKNQNGVASVQITSAMCNSLDVNQKKHQQIQHSDKRVRFSGKDVILGHTKKRCSSVELPQMQSLRKVFPDVMADQSIKDQSVASGVFLPSTVEAPEVNENDKDDSLSIVDESEVRSMNEMKQLDDVQGHFIPPTIGCSRSRHDMEKVSLDESVDLNQAWQQYDSLHLFNPGSPISHNLSCIPKVMNSIPKEGINCHMGIQAEGSIRRPLNTNQNFPDPFIFPVARPAAIVPLVNTTRNTTSQPLLPCLAADMETIEKQPYPLQAIRPEDSSGYSLQYQPLSHLSPKDLISSIRSTSAEMNKQSVNKNGQFGEPRAISDSVSACRNKSTDDDFVGLPLNSQGELVQLHSSGKPGFNQVFKKQNTAMASVGSFQVHNLLGPKSTMDHSNMKEKLHGGSAFPNLKWFPERNFAKVPVPSRSGFTELQGIGRREVHFPDTNKGKMQSTSQSGLEMNLMSSSSHGYREYIQSRSISEREKNQVQGNLESAFQPAAQPTMRLMGKNVTVGRGNKEGQGSEDGNIWTDKEIISEHHRNTTVAGISIPKRGFQPEWVVHPVSGTSRESVTPIEASSLLQMTAAEPMRAHTNINCQTHLMSISDLPLIDGDHVANFHPFSQQLPSQALLHMTSMLPENSISGTESFKMGHQIPLPMSDPHNCHLQHMLLSSAQCKHNQSLAYSTTLPFPNQDRREYVQPSCAQRSSPSLPPWLRDATQLKETPYSSLSHPDASIAKHYPCTMSGTNLLPLPPYITSAISFPARSSNTYTCMQNPSTPASLVHDSFIPTLPGFRPASAISTSFRNRSKMRDRTNAKSTCSKDLDGAKKAKKRPAAKTDETTKPMKKPNLEMQKDLNSWTGPQKGEYLHGYTRYNTGTPALHAHGDKPVTEIEKDEFRTTSGVNSFKLDAVAKSGPIKLSAGAKHILKPSQNMDQDNSRPTHSTIPFAVVADSGKMPDFQRKTAKIYRF
ncbi:uncharacterized protein LOC131240925 isoform X2 [Magnolia sinica]|uniref:uncharacterized protein LOC131240925 isoform X2 n=1 Tax=Magnolia sinica TaxID=86752 RepID=UPI002658328D|nr:uncharacterized protein LOC131240925 isoform X2 [Magnolia sinica]